MTRKQIDTRLRAIEREMDALRLERRKLKIDRDQLIQKANRANKARYESDLPTKLIEILTDRPGSTLSEICDHLGDAYTRRQVSHALYNLSRPHRNKVENRGGRTLNAEWYVVA